MTRHAILPASNRQLAARLRAWVALHADNPIAPDVALAAELAELAPPPPPPDDFRGRDRLLRELRTKWFPNVGNARAAELIREAAAKYYRGQFARDRHDMATAPPRAIVGTRAEMFWRLAVEGGPIPGVERLKQIFGNRT